MAQEVGVGHSIDCTEVREYVRGVGKGQGAVMYPYSLQRLKIPRRRISGTRENKEETGPCFRTHWVERDKEKDEVEEIQSQASMTSPSFCRVICHPWRFPGK